jgi:hypothetical protein
LLSADQCMTWGGGCTMCMGTNMWLIAVDCGLLEGTGCSGVVSACLCIGMVSIKKPSCGFGSFIVAGVARSCGRDSSGHRCSQAAAAADALAAAGAATCECPRGGFDRSQQQRRRPAPRGSCCGGCCSERSYTPLWFVSVSGVTLRCVLCH